MAIIALRINEQEKKDIDRLDHVLRYMDQDVKSRSDAIKAAVRIALAYIERSPLFPRSCITPPETQKIRHQHRSPITQIQSEEIDIHGKRIKKI